MALLRINTKIEVVDDGGRGKVYPIVNCFTGVEEIFVQELDVAASATVTVWDPTNWTGFEFTAFDRLVMFATKDLELEMTINEGHADEELNSFRLIADMPFILGSNAAYYNHTASDAFSGTLDVIDKIRVKEINGVPSKLTLIMTD